MKTLLTALFSLLMIPIIYAQPPKIKYITAADANTYWGIGTDEKAWQWKDGSWKLFPATFQNFEPTNKRLKQIDASADGSVWAVGSDDKIWKLSSNTWIQVPGGLKHISVANNNQVWGVNAAGNVWKWTGTEWIQPNPDVRLAQIDVADDGTLWGVGQTDNIWQYNGMSWSQFPGALRHITTSAGNWVWGVNGNGQVWYLDRGDWKEPTPASRLKQIETATDGTLIGVNDAYQVWRWNSSEWEEVLPLPASQATYNPGIVIYEHENFGGQSLTLTSNWDQASNPEWNDLISSIRIPEGYKIQIFEHSNFQGQSMILSHDWNHRDNPGFNDFISSIKILEYPKPVPVVPVPQGITLFEHENFKGESLTINSIWDATRSPWNDRISSIRIPEGYQIQVYENSNFRGNSLTLNSDWTTSQNPDFNDAISSIRFLSVPPAGTIAPVVVPAVVIPATVPAVEATVAPALPCSLPDKQYHDLSNAIKSKPFPDTRMSTAKVGLKGKCLSIDQIRGLAKLFSFEGEKLEFIKMAYNHTDEKSEYYTLSDAFSFSSTIDDFNKFLETKN